MFLAAVDQHRKLHAARAAKIDQLIESRANGAAGIKHVVDQDDVAILDVAGKFCAIDYRLGADSRKVVAIERDVEHADGRPVTFEVRDFIGHALGERHAAAANADEKQVARAVVFFDHFGRQTSQRAIDARAIHDASLLDEVHVRGYYQEVFSDTSCTLTKRQAPSTKRQSMVYRSLVRRLLFSLPPETAHELALHSLSLLRPKLINDFVAQHYAFQSAPVNRFGISFPNAVGLAAGFDKDGVALPALAALGFGFIEAGTVTFHPQPGNPRPRLFRLPEDKALINRAGFNNSGAAAFAKRVAGERLRCVLGVSIGKSKITPLEQATEDYLASFELVYDLADYVAVNVSSPNTPQLRQLQQSEQLAALLSALQERNRALQQAHQRSQPMPLLVKLSPDLTSEDLELIVDVVVRLGIDGIIATNTTIARDHLRTDRDSVTKIGEGGLSGAPLRERSTRMITDLYRLTNGRVPIIGVGGIFTAEDAWEKISAGASLVQLYTGFIYSGPSIAREINKGLQQILNREGLTNLDAAVGCRAEERSN